MHRINSLSHRTLSTVKVLLADQVHCLPNKCPISCTKEVDCLITYSCIILLRIVCCQSVQSTLLKCSGFVPKCPVRFVTMLWFIPSTLSDLLQCSGFVLKCPVCFVTMLWIDSQVLCLICCNDMALFPSACLFCYNARV